MSDLISRSELLKAMETWDKFGYDEHNRLIRIDSTDEEYVPYVRYEDMVNCVMNMPTAYDVDKVVEELEEIRAKKTCNKEKCDTKEICRICVVDDAIEIVKQEAEQCNNGWIPCSEKLPELRKDVLVTVKYTGFMGMYGYWIRTGHMEAEKDWWGDCAGGEVIAWQPLPEPFKESD